jgi:hypothetical protein
LQDRSREPRRRQPASQAELLQLNEEIDYESIRIVCTGWNVCSEASA